jgi:ferredoxin
MKATSKRNTKIIDGEIVMKIVIVYYSGSGGTTKLAKAIHRGALKNGDPCDLLWIKDAEPKSMDQYDLIFLGSPIWFIRETANLRKFVYEMPVMKGKLCALFCAHGVLPAGFMYSLGFAVKRKKMKIIGWNDWYADVKHVLHLPHPYYTTGHPDNVDEAEAEVFGASMVERAKKIMTGDLGLIPKTPRIKDFIPLWMPHRPKDHTQFNKNGRMLPPNIKFHRSIDTRKCTYPECTLCVDNCMMGAINFKNSPPTIKDDCANCFICDRLCPNNAVILDEASLARKTRMVIDGGKCIYPECNLCLERCPMDCIDMSKSPPTVDYSCEACCICWAICPEGAVEIPNLDLSQPDIKIESPEEKARFKEFTWLMEEDEKKGKFRRLYPAEKVDIRRPQKLNANLPRMIIDE